MPIYVYRCPNCGHQFDKMQPFSAANVYPCPSCNAEARRQIQPAGIVFKGSGWYITDSRKEDAARAKKAGVKVNNESSAESSTTASDNASSDSAPSAAPGAPAKDTATSNPATPASIGPSSTPV